MKTVTISTSPHKITIAVNSGGLTQFTILCAWILGWGVGGGLLLHLLIRDWYTRLFSPRSTAVLYLLCYPTAFIIFGSIALTALAFGVARGVDIMFTSERTLFGEQVWCRTKLIAKSETLTVADEKLGRREASRVYALEDISNIRLAQQPERADAYSVLFDDGERSVVCCRNLQLEDALQLLRLFFDLIRFRCHTVERIVFSASDEAEDDADRTLWNPDVSSLTIPFPRLREIWIVAENCDVHLTERFVTYALNVQGRSYMQRHVDVCIHGDAALIQPRLLDSLTSICRRVRVY